ncbi:Protein PER1 [Dirofilaria immitis]
MQVEKHMNIVIALFALVLLAKPTNGSVGDRHHIFLACTESCIMRYGCPQEYDESGWIFGECFSCIWETVEYFTDILRLSVPQFHGKWPFLAVWLPFIMPIPIQEFASVIFSILNLLTTLSMHRAVKRLHDSNRLKIIWIAYSVIGIIMWTCSTIFHWADFWLTEYLDYFTTCAFIVFALFASISFTIKPLRNCYRGRILWSFLFITLVYLYTNHIYNLMIYFDYGYNMKICVACSLLTAIIYYVWLAQQWKLRNRSGRRSLSYLIVTVTWALLSFLFEVLDFAPIYWIIDSHSLFHLATVPLPLLLTRFILLENAYEMQKQLEIIKQT